MQIALFGDILIQGVTAEAVETKGGERLTAALRDRIGGAGLSVANFETFVCPEGVEPANQWHSPPAAVDIVARAGLDVVSVANNHTWDHGAEAVRHTLELIDAAGLARYGLGDETGGEPEPLVVKREGVRVGFLGYATASTITRRPSWTGIAPSPRRLWSDVKALREGCDLVIVSLHHGEPKWPDPEQRRWARAAAEAGAAACVFHHSHIVSGVERVGDCLVAHGLANVVGAELDDDGRNRWRQGLCVRLDVREGGAVEADWEPVVIDTEGVPGPGSDAEREEIRQAVEEVNQRLAGEDYSSFYYSSVAAQMLPGYFESWKRDVRTYGWKTLLGKPRRIRPHHFRLLWSLLRKRGTSP
jgi:poly-gamma-glutamate synthesis protein (capsule biosynthesis protein)